MDPLPDMLTDPLEPKEENVGQITEECMLGSCKVKLPEDLLEDVGCITSLSVVECCELHGFGDNLYLLSLWLCLIYLFLFLFFCSQQPDIFFSVMSESTWNNVLSDSQRQHLRQFLPQFPDNNISEQDSTINDLFNNRNFNFGNPLHLAQRLFRGVSSWCDCIPASTLCLNT